MESSLAYLLREELVVVLTSLTTVVNNNNNNNNYNKQINIPLYILMCSLDMEAIWPMG